MNTNTHPASGQEANPPRRDSGNLPESIDLLFILPGKDGKPVTHLHAEDAVAAGDAYWHIDPLGGERTLRPCRILPSAKRSPFKRTGKSARRPGIISAEALSMLAAAAVFWTVFGAILFALEYWASR